MHWWEPGDYTYIMYELVWKEIDHKFRLEKLPGGAPNWNGYIGGCWGIPDCGCWSSGGAKETRGGGGAAAAGGGGTSAETGSCDVLTIGTGFPQPSLNSIPIKFLPVMMSGLSNRD